MDQFIKNIFSHFSSPGAEFVYGDGYATHTYFKGQLRVSDGFVLQHRQYSSFQVMTPLGLMAASLNGAPSSLDGVSKQYLTPEGNINLSTLSDAVKAQSGMQAGMWSAHMGLGLVSSWSWVDNQVSLLVNMLRFTMLRNLTEGEVNPFGASLGMYDDGHMAIDMDQFFNAAYPGQGEWEWPGGATANAYPAYVRIEGYAPGAGGDCVDLRTLSVNEARYVLLMLGQWRRRSRFRLDFSLPRLAEEVYYRYPYRVQNVDGWLDNIGIAERQQQPQLPTAQASWLALRKYFTQNRLYGAFSTALYLVCGMMYQFKPATAEAAWWLGCPWYASLSKFSAVRGRYLVLNEGEAALISHRSLAEWSFIGNHLERINLIALTFCQASQIGIAVRAIRRGLELDSSDIMATEGEFYTAKHFYSAAVSEATRSPFPLSGMSNVYIYCDVPFETYDEERTVTTLLDGNQPGPEGYAWSVESEDVLVPANNRTIRAGNGVVEIEEVEPQPPVAVSRKRLVVSWVPMAGVPTLLLPLQPFERNTPFSLNGVIDKMNTGKVGRRGWQIDYYTAWNLAYLLRLCGYDVIASGDMYFSPNDANFVWPNLREPEYQGCDTVVTRMIPRDYNTIMLPEIHTKFFRGIIDYKTNILQRAVAAGPFNNEVTISEYGV